MRPRTRRLKSLLVGMVRSFGQATGDTPPSDYARGDPKAGTADPGVCPPLPHGGPGWGRAMRLGADRAPESIVHRGGGGGKRTAGVGDRVPFGGHSPARCLGV